MTKLPDGWKEIELGDIFEFQKKSIIKAGEGKAKGKFKFFTSSDKQTKSLDTYKLDGEYLIFATGGHAGIHYCNEKFATSTDCFVAKVKDSILSKYVYYYLYGRIYLLEEGFKGAGLKHISKGHIQKLKIIYPEDKTTQQKIVSILEKAEKAKEWRKEADELTKDFLKSVFMEMFGDPAKNPQRFKIEIMSDLLAQNREGTKCGPFGSALKKEEYLQNGVPVWTMDNIQNNKFIPDGCLFISKKKYEELKSYSTISGDIIISRAGTVGKMCVVTTEFPNSIISTNLIRLSLNHQKILPMYFTSLMIYCEGSVGRLKTGAEGAYTFMNTGVLKKIKIPLPPLELQQKFAAIVAQVEEIKSHQKQSKARIDDLFNALMQKSFKGELVV